MQRYPDGDAALRRRRLDACRCSLGVRRVEVIGARARRARGDERRRALRASVPTRAREHAPSGPRDSDAWPHCSGLAAGRAYSFDTKADKAGVFVDRGRGPRATEPLVDRADAAHRRSTRRGPATTTRAGCAGCSTRSACRTSPCATRCCARATSRASSTCSSCPSVARARSTRAAREGSVPDAFAGGLDPEGAVAIEEFVRGGGTLVAIGGSATWAIDSVEAAVRRRDDDGRGRGVLVSRQRAARHPGRPSAFTSDLDESIAVFFSRGQAFRDMTTRSAAKRTRRRRRSSTSCAMRRRACSCRAGSRSPKRSPTTARGCARRTARAPCTCSGSARSTAAGRRRLPAALPRAPVRAARQGRRERPARWLARRRVGARARVVRARA